MGTYALQDSNDIRRLVGVAFQTDEPVVVFDGEDECLIAMQPAVFERILFDCDLLNSIDRESLHL